MGFFNIYIRIYREVEEIFRKYCSGGLGSSPLPLLYTSVQISKNGDILIWVSYISYLMSEF